MLTENSETLGVENCLQPISKNADIHLQKLKNTFFVVKFQENIFTTLICAVGESSDL